MAPKLNYCNTVNNVGSIYNQYTIIMAGNKDVKAGIIRGTDSACGNIVGPLSSFRINDNFDFMLGGYNTNFNSFKKRNMIPVSFGNVTPIIGVDFKLFLYKSKSTSISIDNLISFGIITHAISWSF